MDLREEVVASMLECCYEDLNKVTNGTVCKRIPIALPYFHCTIVGSYMSFLMAHFLYPVRPQAAYERERAHARVQRHVW